MLADRRDLDRMVRRCERDVRGLAAGLSGRSRPKLNAEEQAVYLRSDLIFGLQAGGSVGHIAGVLNNLEHFGRPPLFISTDQSRRWTMAIATSIVDPDPRFRDFVDAPLLAFNRRLIGEAERAIGGRRVSFVYQRYSAYNYAGTALARSLRVPFVLEYNGSEVWVNRNWGRPLRYEAARSADRVRGLARGRSRRHRQ